jgi:quinohemoprotein ethanol dehydrogenase
MPVAEGLAIMETSGTYAFDPDFVYQVGRMNVGRLRAAANPATPAPPRPLAVGAGGAQQKGAFLVAWDPIAEKERWRITFDRPGVTSGTVATASNLVFHGSNDGSFSAYSAEKGEKLWSVPLAPGFSNPITYELGGQQYIVTLTGQWNPSAGARLLFRVERQSADSIDGSSARARRFVRVEPPISARNWNARVYPTLQGGN